MRRRARAAAGPTACLLILLAGAAKARADEVSASATHTLLLERRLDNQNGRDDDDDYGVMVNRFNLNGGGYGVTAHARLDTTTFAEPPQLLGRPYKNDLRLERLEASYRLGDFELTAGDFYREVGRGIVLSLRKQDEIGLDVAIRGGQVRWHGQVQEASVFAGLINPVNLDSVSQKFVRDTDDLVAGATYELRALPGAAFGAHAVYLQPRQSLLRDSQDWSQSAGVYADLAGLADWLAIYAEGDVQVRRAAGADQQGYAGYLTADMHFGDFGVLLEGILLRGISQRGSNDTALGNRFVYNRPPTLQRIREEITDEQRDVAAGRVHLSETFEDLDLTFFVDGLFRAVGEDAGILQAHGWAGVEWAFAGGAGKLALTSGYRHEMRSDGVPIKELVHLEGDLIVPLGAGYALHATTDTEFRSAEKDYVRGSTIVGVERPAAGSLSMEMGIDTQRESDPTDPHAVPLRNYFLAGIAAVEVSSAVQVNVVAGTQRGGLKCIAGVCREYPPFAGARVEMVARW